MLDRAPSVLITSKQNELKVYQNNVVYLNNGDNFELRFFNPLKEKVGVEIVFNGIRKGDGYLVLNPGQDIILDRFLDEQRKMLFETYTVDGDNPEAVKAIEKNGLISFNFYRESLYRNNPTVDVNINYNFPPKPWRSSDNVYSSKMSNGVFGAVGAAGTPGTFSTVNANSRTYTSSSVFTSTVSENYATLSNVGGMGLTSNTILNNLETGRVEKGEQSDQNLKTVNLQFAQTSFHSISYKILPYSTMNQTLNEVRQYCPNCKYRLRKQSWKFCPQCGEDLN